MEKNKISLKILRQRQHPLRHTTRCLNDIHRQRRDGRHPPLSRNSQRRPRRRHCLLQRLHHRRREGSPHALEERTPRGFGASRSSVTLNVSGRSYAEGGLYSHVPAVRFLPVEGSRTISSCKKYPTPNINPPSTWPMSTTGFTLIPQSKRISVRTI